MTTPRHGAPGTTEQKPRWEGPPQTGLRAICQPKTIRTKIAMPPAKTSRILTNAISEMR